GDLLFGEYSTRLAERHAGAGGRTFMSRFARQRTGAEDEGDVRAWHCADIPFAFGNLADAHLHFLIGGPPTPADHELSHRMLTAWAAFATTGDPGWRPVAATGPAGPADLAATGPAGPADRAVPPGPTPVRAWGASGTPPPVDARPLWRTAAYLPLRP
ncbi:MAG TPA: carboxylesterase family protein, partial [Streptomyces sp.]|nr:carboxylesterase family protein [Streptomyces sp.]